MRRTRNEIIFQITFLSALTLLTALQTDPRFRICFWHQFCSLTYATRGFGTKCPLLFLAFCCVSIRDNILIPTNQSTVSMDLDQWEWSSLLPSVVTGTDICLSSAERQPGQQSDRQRGGDHQAVPGNQQQGHQQGGLLQVSSHWSRAS